MGSGHCEGGLLVSVRKMNLQNLIMFISVILMISSISFTLIVGADKHLTTPNSDETLSIVNPCDTDQLVVSDKHVQLHAYTNSTSCSLLVTTENSTAISVTVLKSDINNVYTYFYIKILESATKMCSERYLLVSGSHTPCKVIIPGNQFRFHFQNTDMMVEIHTEEVELSTCYDIQLSRIGFERCNVTSYESEIQWSQKRQSFRYGKYWWYRHNITVDVFQYQVMCACDCPDTCMCTLGYREWVSICIDSTGSKTTKADLIVYNPSLQGLSFANSGMHMIQQHTFLGLEGLKVLILSHNILTILPPTVCQYLQQLEILKIDNNRLANVTSDILEGQCEQTLLMLNLSSNELINLPNDLFKTTNKSKTLDLRQNRLIQLCNDSFSSLTTLEILYLSDNELRTLLSDVFASLGRLHILDLSGNAISSLPPDVFASLGDWLHTLDLSGNSISSLPHDVFALLGELRTLGLSGNVISSLPPDAFALLGELNTLDLSGNAIFTFPPDVFTSLGKLWNLYLSRNAISTLPQGVFASLGSLNILDLSSNAISSLPHEAFASLGLLLTLDLCGNSISSLPSDVFASQGKHRLRTLDLSGNVISSLPHDVFASLRQLRTLDLSGNVISSLPHDVFASLGQLFTLDLSGNVISSLPHDVFTLVGIKSLNISYNNISHILSSSTFQSLRDLITLDLITMQSVHYLMIYSSHREIC